jgi:hypothetical protein
MLFNCFFSVCRIVGVMRINFNIFIVSSCDVTAVDFSGDEISCFDIVTDDDKASVNCSCCSSEPQRNVVIHYNHDEIVQVGAGGRHDMSVVLPHLRVVVVAFSRHDSMQVKLMRFRICPDVSDVVGIFFEIVHVNEGHEGISA